MLNSKSADADIGVILLAAGTSSRLGRPKQLLLYNGQTLLQHALQAALESKSQPIVVVLGAEATTLRNEIRQNNIHIVENREWKEGMASSIRCGIKALMQISPEAVGVILMVCDQPFVTASLLNELIRVHQKGGKFIVASSYAGTFGPPSFFHHVLFEQLLQLKGDVGARGLIQLHRDAVEVIPFPEGAYDIDTQADYERIKSRGNN